MRERTAQAVPLQTANDRSGLALTGAQLARGLSRPDA